MDQARVGFIGVGGVAGGHLNILNGFEDAELAALCDIDEGRLKGRAEAFGVANAYTDYREMLSAEELDAVYVCVPPFAHGQIEEEIAAAGAALFVEKPVELHMEPAVRKHEAIRDAGILNTVGYCVRYLSTVDDVARTLEGVQIDMALGYYMGGAPGGWWRQLNKSGGQLVEQTTHIVDTARYLVGDVAAVGGAFAAQTPLDDSADIENVSIAHLFFENGAVGAVMSACMLGRGFKTGLDIFAKGYTAEFTYGKTRVHTGGESHEFDPNNNMYESEDRAFIDAVKTGDRSALRVDYADAVKSLEVSLLAREANDKRAVLETTFKG